MPIRDILALAPVIPVLTVERAEDAVPLATALVAGGLPVLEITLRTEAALEAIRLMAREVEGAIVGVGTVTTPSDLDRAAEAGARFAVSPGLTETLARAEGPPLLPGIATPGDLMRGLEIGLDTFKFFPASVYGGPSALKAFHGPFPNVRFCPTGGVTPENARQYLDLPNVLCVGGTWVAPPAAVREGAWDEVRRLAGEAAALRT